MKSLILIICFLILTSCNLEKKIDAASEENLQQSISSIMKELNKTKQKDFENSLKTIMFEDADNLVDLAAMGQNAAVSKGIFQAKVDGKTADEIIKMAREIKISIENKKPIEKRTGVPVPADNFLGASTNDDFLDNQRIRKENTTGAPISADTFLSK